MLDKALGFKKLGVDIMKTGRVWLAAAQRIYLDDFSKKICYKRK